MTDRGVDRTEVFFWGLFAVGGMVAALLVPVHILIQGVLGPLGITPSVSMRYSSFATALSNPLVKLYLFVLISLPLFHWAHRFRFLLPALGIRGGKRLVAVLCYGCAAAVTLASAYVLLTVP